jgi:D-serine deaminase-like pyridoxal phosphate-dependent protein
MTAMSLGANRHLIGRPVADPEFATPALLVDRPALTANIVTMARLAAAGGVKLRPHAKAHKSSLLARMLADAGAIGACAATVREIEVLADAGLSGLLLTTPIASPGYVARLVHAREKVESLAAVVDNRLEVDMLAAMARQARPIDILVDVDMGLGRTGVTSGAEAVDLARRIAAAPALRYRGVQAYYGHLQHVAALADRRAKIAEQWRHLAGVLDALASAGFKAEIVSGGGTGTHHVDLDEGPFTELQPGSYLFMDRQYGAVEITPGGSPFVRALAVAARVVSVAQPDRVIVDAGSKAFSTDAGPPAIASGAPTDATYQFMGDEHGAVRVPPGSDRPALGDLITFVAPHCDPTVNLHDQLHITENGRLTDIWPIEARGH